ncbi:MAG: hypothetical protein EAZ89_05640 [Bacteroidetes bacterium]|nr:MAG: hypothetical protein EAZ89_05640 [Bacteroidota bacterium]
MALGQQILFDKGVRIGQLTAFPEISNPNNYYYLPDKIEVAKHPDGKPMFSFIRYVRNSAPAAGSAAAVSEASNAGGVLHVLVNLNVSPEVIRESERELQRKFGSARIIGPVIYKSGKIALISSVIGTDGEMTQKVVGIGNAPIMEGQKAAVSVLLTKQGADILWATFQTPTPDLSFAFEMDARGYLSPKNVRIEADFEQIYRNQTIEAAVVSPVLAAEINLAFEQLSNSGAIKVTQIGEDADLNKLKETAYNQLVNLMFDRVGGQSATDLNSVLPGNNRSMLDRATDMLSRARTEAREENNRAEEAAAAERRARSNARRAILDEYRSRGQTAPAWLRDTTGTPTDNVQRVPVPSFAIAASFRLKEVRRTGKYLIDLNKYTEDQRTFPFSENVGNVLKTCPTCFSSVNLDDPLYKQRDIHVRLVDVNNEDFGTYISSVEVLMRKKHENGEITNGNVIISKEAFNTLGNDFPMQYGWKGDNNRDKWLNYEYRTRWVFSGGFSVETEWKPVQFASIDLDPPLSKKTIYVEMDPDMISAENIRAAEIKLYYKNGDKENVKTVNIKASDNILSKSVELVLPRSAEDYQYEITWFVKGKEPFKTARKSSNLGSLYLYSL